MNRWSYHLPILGYHRVGRFRGDHVPTVSADAFERQLALLARFRYRVLTLEALVQGLEAGELMPRHSAVITFDDGYEETCSIAWPLLKRFGFPATMFIAPGDVGRPAFVTWDQVRLMARDGIAIGSHTMHHVYLPVVEPHRLAEEVVHSKQLIEAQLQQPVQFLSYPVGGFTPQVQALAQQAGYRAACTTNRAASFRRIDRFALRRIKVTERDSHPLLFLAKLSGYYDLFRQLRMPG